jgi:hypothetical protein
MSKRDSPTVDTVAVRYDTPRAVRLGPSRQGTGGSPCVGPGSGADINCSTGFTAEGACESNGNTAIDCLGAGNDESV